MTSPVRPRPSASAASALLTAQIVPTLLRLSLPNMLSMLATALVAVAETAYVGRLGIAALAGMALVFPMVMLQQMMSAGAMGGGISSAISRALGSGDEPRAESLVLHATMIGLTTGAVFTCFFLVLGPALYSILGGSGEALAEALAYSNVVFIGASAIWLTNTLASTIRGCGNMRVPSIALFLVAALQIILGGGLGLGIFPFPKLGMRGIALGQVVAYACGAALLTWYLLSGNAKVSLRFRFADLRWEMFRDILKVGAVACIAPVQAILTILILTRLVSYFGTEALAGYGIGARLEFLLIPVVFSIGVSCVPMVGMAIGAGNVERARRVAWTGGAISALCLGVIGLLVALGPDLWAGMFTSNAAVMAMASLYFAWAGPCYAFFGLGLCLYFSSLGSGRILGPVLAATVRLFVVACGGWWLAQSQQPPWTIFALVGLSMFAYGASTAIAVFLTRWGPPKVRSV
ncbi:MAG: MATE family efflux transporter [Proteobacteria bacterium]|nr:MATE family efflux transporter [Pseudomonadota bacterium]